MLFVAIVLPVSILIGFFTLKSILLNYKNGWRALMLPSLGFLVGLLLLLYGLLILAMIISGIEC